MNSETASIEAIIEVLGKLPSSELKLFQTNPPAHNDRDEKAVVDYYHFFRDLVCDHNTESSVPRAFNLHLQILSAIYLERFGRSEESQKMVSKILSKYSDQLVSFEEGQPKLAVLFRTLVLLHAQKTAWQFFVRATKLMS